MKSYDLPGDTSFMEPDEARRAANKFRADILADRDHPYNDPAHPQHADFSAHFRQLYGIINEGEADAQADATAQELAEALGEDAGLSPAECLARAKELLLTPGYVTGTGTLSSGDREKLTRKIHALHTVARQETSALNTEVNDDELS